MFCRLLRFDSSANCLPKVYPQFSGGHRMKKEDAATSNTEPTDTAPLLVIHEREGINGLVLRNDLNPRYKKPSLPFGGRSAKVHHHLRELKVSQTLMMECLVNFQETLWERYSQLGLVLSMELWNFEAEYVDQRQNWIDEGMPFAPIVSGLLLHMDPGENHYVSFDDRSFNHSYLKGVPRDETMTILGPLFTAIRFYNESVTALFESDFMIYPAYFWLQKAQFYPMLPLKHKVVDF